MCRMISIVKPGGIGKDLFDVIWNALRGMASDQTFRHELHDELALASGEYTHGDGWGCAWLNASNSLEVYHQLVPIWQADLSGKLVEEMSSSPLLMIHARRASPGFAVTEDYCHPFIRESPALGQAAFAHNGTVQGFEQLEFSDHFTPTLRSDTERFFYAVLTALEKQAAPRDESLGNLVANLPEYSGANFLLFIENELWASRNFTQYEEFLSLYYLVDSGFAVVSSEKIPLLGSSWVNLMNHQLIRVNIRDFDLTVF